MSYDVAYGADTGSIEDPDQLFLISAPDSWAGLDTDELSARIAEEWLTGVVKVQPLVPLGEVLGRMAMAMEAVGMKAPAIAEVVRTVMDAVDNAA